jgi:DNA-binding response OmpR family regulator
MVSPRVLVVDCDPNTRDLYCRELAAAGFDVRFAADGAGALRLLRDWDPQLAVLDARLGDESGLDLLRHLLEVRNTLATILVSTNPGYRDDFVSWLADAFLLKRLDASELVARAQQLIAVHAA